MGTTKTILSLQYAMVQDARSELLKYCSAIKHEDFIRVSEHVGNGGSIKTLMIHICNCYFAWLSAFASKQPFNKVAYDAFDNFEQCAAYFGKVDTLMAEFLNNFDNNYDISITGPIAGASRTATPFQLFAHVTTHEFHHKGQILTLSRMWGYVPIDTDVLR